MTHDADSYKALGYKAGKAMRAHDVALFNHHNDYFRRWLALESADEKSTARASFNEGYIAAR